MIRSLRIENFKCFKEQRLELGRLTILSGANGVGKSTSIQALLLLRETWGRLRAAAAGAVPQGPTSPISLNGPYNLCLGNSQAITNAEIDSSAMVLGLASTDGRRAELRFQVDVDSPRTTIDYLGATAGDGGRSLLDPLALFADEFHYLVAERVGPRDLYGMVDQPFVSTGFAGEYTAQAISRAAKRHVADTLCVAEGTSLFRVQLEAWLEKVTPGIQITTFEYAEVNRIRVGIQRRGSGTNWLSPSNIGFGVSYVLPVIVSGLLAPNGSMLIVENPEAHLHPAAQSEIGRFLARVALSGVQVIVETHSENVVNGARLEALQAEASKNDVRFLFFSMPDQRAEPEVTSIGMDERGDLTAWPIGFFDQQSRDLASLFRARRAGRLS